MTTCEHFIHGSYVGLNQQQQQPSAAFIEVTTPHTGETIARVPVGTSKDVERAVESAHTAFTSTWSTKTIK